MSFLKFIAHLLFLFSGVTAAALSVTSSAAAPSTVLGLHQEGKPEDATSAAPSASPRLQYRGIHYDEDQPYKLYTWERAHSHPLDVDNTTFVTPEPIALQPARPDSAITKFKRWVSDQIPHNFGGKWEHCEVYQKPRNVWGCHNRHNYAPWINDVGDKQFPDLVRGLLIEAFGNYDRPATPPRAVCLVTPGTDHRFCISWHAYFQDVMEMDTMEMVIQRVRMCGALRDSAMGWVRFARGEEHVLCFSNRAKGCALEVCPKMNLPGLEIPRPGLDPTLDPAELYEWRDHKDGPP